MESFSSSEDILRFAITKEEEAEQFYTELADMVRHASLKEVFRKFAAEEGSHRAKLQQVLDGKQPAIPAASVPDLRIADYTADRTPHPDMNYQEALLTAMHREKAAYRLYTDLAERTESDTLRELFAYLAGEEAKHKLRFEIEYDDTILTDN